MGKEADNWAAAARSSPTHLLGAAGHPQGTRSANLETLPSPVWQRDVSTIPPSSSAEQTPAISDTSLPVKSLPSFPAAFTGQEQVRTSYDQPATKGQGGGLWHQVGGEAGRHRRVASEPRVKTQRAETQTWQYHFFLKGIINYIFST